MSVTEAYAKGYLQFGIGSPTFKGDLGVLFCVCHIGETNIGVIEITHKHCTYVRRGIKINPLAFMG